MNQQNAVAGAGRVDAIVAEEPKVAAGMTRLERLHVEMCIVENRLERALNRLVSPPAVNECATPKPPVPAGQPIDCRIDALENEAGRLLSRMQGIATKFEAAV